MADIYAPDRRSVRSSSAPLNPAFCKAGVTDNDRAAHYHQCGKRAVRDGWCATHHPDAEADRSRASQDRYEAETRRRAMGWYGEQWLAALCKIRDGDCDPRETALAALDGVSYEPR